MGRAGLASGGLRTREKESEGRKGGISMKKTRLSRRGFVLLSAEVATGAIAAACAPKATEKEGPVETVAKETVVVEKEATKPGEVVTVEWWYGYTGEYVKEGLRPAADAFEAENPGIKINGTEVGSGMYEKLLTAVAAGTPPDMSQNIPYLELIARGGCLPLTAWIDASTILDRASGDIPDGQWKAFTWKGDIYGVPGIGLIGEALAYNLDIIEAAGLDPNSPPQTWDEVFEWHKATTKFDAAGNVAVVGLDPLDAMGGSIGDGDPWMWPPSWGFDYFDEDALVFNTDRPETAEFFRTIKMFYDHVGVEKMEGFRKSYGTWVSPGSSFPSGVQAMQITGSYAPGSLATVAPDKRFGYTWMPVPSSRKGKKVQVMGAHAQVILKGAKHPEAAFRFAEWLTTAKAMDIIYKGCGFIGTRKSWMKTVDASKPKGIDWYLRSVDEADELWAPQPDPVVATTADEFRKGIDAVNYDGKAAEQAAKDMQEAQTKALEGVLEAR